MCPPTTQLRRLWGNQSVGLEEELVIQLPLQHRHNERLCSGALESLSFPQVLQAAAVCAVAPAQEVKGRYILTYTVVLKPCQFSFPIFVFLLSRSISCPVFQVAFSQPASHVLRRFMLAATRVLLRMLVMRIISEKASRPNNLPETPRGVCEWVARCLKNFVKGATAIYFPDCCCFQFDDGKLISSV